MTDNKASKSEIDSWNAPQYDYAYIISGYIQTGFNLFIVLVLVYLAVQAILTIQRDVQQKVDEYSLGKDAAKMLDLRKYWYLFRSLFVAIMKEISVCAKLYHENRCDPENRVPAMDEPCRNWETCMDRDPDTVGRYISLHFVIGTCSKNLFEIYRAKVSAETFAEIVNGFIDPISYKSMVIFTSRYHARISRPC